MPSGPNGTRCRVCGCTYEHACAGGCGWAANEKDLCTTCETAIAAVAVWYEDAVKSSRTALKREVEKIAPAWCVTGRSRRKARKARKVK